MSAVLSRPVLVLNRLWQPVHTCSVKRALKLLFLGHAQVVQTDGETRYQTHDILSWKEHSELIRAGAEKAEEAETGVGDLIHSINMALRAPKIIVLSLYDRIPRKEVKFSRQNVFLRDRHTCQYCRNAFPESKLNLDHVHPRGRGGKTSWENIVASCVPCNSRKANRLPHEAGMKLLKEPRAPRWRPLFGFREQAGDETWEEFLLQG